VEVNLGSIGKGYAIDRALDLIAGEFRAPAVLMHGGQSSLKALGAPPDEPRGWKVEIGDPYNPRRRIASVWLKNQALGTSSAANQWFEQGGRRYGHVLDPRTGRPAQGMASASVLSPTAAEADALSTAFFVMGIEPARQYCQQHPEIGAVLVAEPRAGQAPEAVLLGQVLGNARPA
jgi:thiamine biosynthesis lipoprotein